MGEFIRIDTDEAQTKRLFDRVVAAVNNPERAMRSMSLDLRSLVHGTFRSETDPWGTAWPPHSPTTLAERKRKGILGRKLLVERAGPQSLFGSIAAENTASTATVTAGGNENNFPEVHQFGNPDNLAWGQALAPIPARPFMPIDESGNVDFPRDWLIEMLAPLEKYLDSIDEEVSA